MSLSSLEHPQNGRYAVLKKLGEGGKGFVFKVRDTVLDCVVAVKMLKTAVSTDGARSRFIREAQAIAKLHPNSVSIHDIEREDEKHFGALPVRLVDVISKITLRVIKSEIIARCRCGYEQGKN